MHYYHVGHLLGNIDYSCRYYYYGTSCMYLISTHIPSLPNNEVTNYQPTISWKELFQKIVITSRYAVINCSMQGVHQTAVATIVEIKPQSYGWIIHSLHQATSQHL